MVNRPRRVSVLAWRVSNGNHNEGVFIRVIPFYQRIAPLCKQALARLILETSQHEVTAMLCHI